MTAVLHVATTGSDDADGSAEAPFRTINRAAGEARAGDTVVVHGGEYREWVVPRRGGLSDTRRITYTAADGEHVVIKGSERVAGWVPDGGTVWRVSVPGAVFGDFNPFAEEVTGDWIVYPEGAPHKHLGDVYLNGRSFYEVADRAAVDDPPLRTEVLDNWTALPDQVRDAEQTRLVWFAQVGDGETTIWANFQGADPNAELAEINVRRSVFHPLVPHLDYITVRGFELAQAACPWTPPTADQPGLIGPNWAKGWIIEDNVIHDAKCSGISLGKESSTGHNYASERGDKPGYQYQLESVFAAAQIGWDREHIGSHVVRRNTIYDCGQNGIVGHLGCVFSTIEDNHIYNIALKREFYGYEIGGIKLHAAIDVVIRHNRIHDCSMGTWLDWQTQGTRVSRNVYYRNNRDLFVEVSHGPYVVDHNVFGSRASFESFSQGGAFVGNLFAGTLRLEPVMDRATPYHRPHSTQVAGYAVIRGGDDRYIGNIFAGGDLDAAYGTGGDGEATPGYGLAGYDGHPASFEEYRTRLTEQPPGDHKRFHDVLQPVYARDNVYVSGARPFAGETGPRELGDAAVSVVEEGDAVYLATRLPADFDDAGLGALSGRDLPAVRFAAAGFEEADGSPVLIDVDLTGARRTTGEPSAPGPVAALTSGTSRVRLW
ncbi:right-handed parallel beta-helix repeat-containing protein [Actinoplanes sp. NPDC051494]|uniref:right-handed parallel beta-helix repeat-containing protein n=1 Tax=Actinoplanes sp. NPDC051494 TaxID=3363907 RepID=UPI0037B17B5E